MKTEWVKSEYDKDLNIFKIEAFQMGQVRYIEIANQDEIKQLAEEVKKWAYRNPKLSNK